VPSPLHYGRSLILAIALIAIPSEAAAQRYGYGYRGYAGRYVGAYGYGAYPVYRGWGYGYRPYYPYVRYRPYYGYYGYVGPGIFLGAVIPPPPPVYVLPPPPPPLPPPPPPAAPAPPPVAAPAPQTHQCAAGSVMGAGGYCEAVPAPTPERG
jgi:hypothetical protein